MASEIKIINGDCMNGMKQYPDKYFDLMIVDPPYGIGEDGRNNHTRGKLAKAKDYRNDDRYDDEINALANNNINIGDVITDHIGSIKVESIKVEISSFYETPRCVYFGPELRKDKSPKKNGAKRNVWQSNLINQIPTDR